MRGSWRPSHSGCDRQPGVCLGCQQLRPAGHAYLQGQGSTNRNEGARRSWCSDSCLWGATHAVPLPVSTADIALSACLHVAVQVNSLLSSDLVHTSIALRAQPIVPDVCHQANLHYSLLYCLIRMMHVCWRQNELKIIIMLARQ